MSKIAEEEPPLIPLNWLVREIKKTSPTIRKETYCCRLLFKDRVMIELDGPTAQKALQEQADIWNAKNYEPDLKSAGVKILADKDERMRRNSMLKWDLKNG